jgi:hypothetical protein
MATPLSGTHAQVEHIRTHNEIGLLLDGVTFRRRLRGKVACSVSCTDCGRVMRDVVLSVLRGDHGLVHCDGRRVFLTFRLCCRDDDRTPTWVRPRQVPAPCRRAPRVG